MESRRSHWDALSDGQLSKHVIANHNDGLMGTVSQGLEESWPVWKSSEMHFSEPGFDEPRVVFLFSDFDAPYSGMGRSLYETEAVFRNAIDRCAEHLEDLIDQPLTRILWPETGQPSLLHKARYAQPALFSLQYALAVYWNEQGIVPDAVAGYGVGEYAAAAICGVFSLRDALGLVFEHARIWETLPAEHQTMRVFASEDKLCDCLEDFPEVKISAHTAREQVVLAGDRQALRTIARCLDKKNIACGPTTSNHPNQPHLMEGCAYEFTQRVAEMDMRAPMLPFISALTGDEVSEDLANSEYWTHHLVWPVRFEQAVDTLLGEGYDHFIEIGPGADLTALGKGAFRGGKMWMPSMRQGVSDKDQLQRCLNALFKAGVPVNLPALDGI